MERAQRQLRREVIDLRTVVAETVAEQSQAQPRRVIRLAPLPPRPVLVLGDTDRLGQVLANYLTNALKFSEEVQPVEVALEVEESQARVLVHDRGPGIPRGEQEHIWERFYRVAGTYEQSGSGVGLGLGLYISRMIVERHSGRVGVAGAPSEGSTFWFSLPVAVAGR
jgi:signal transduction histidine kinase